MKSLYWVRNDLRVHDNTTFNDFCARSEHGVLVWCPTRSFFRAGVFRRSFILASLVEFQQSVTARGGRLLIFRETAEHVIPKLVKDHGIDVLFWSSEPSVEEKLEEEKIRASVSAEVRAASQGSLVHADDLPFSLEMTPKTFTSFRKKIEPSLKVRPEVATPTKIPFLDIQTDTWAIDEKFSFHPEIGTGEAAGLARLETYIWERDRLKNYKETRNGMMDWDDSSKLSPYLSIGLLSPRRIYDEIQRYETERVKNESTYWLFFELLWRDYFRLISEKLQGDLFGGKHIDISSGDVAFENWRAGTGGDDFVDANMRELNSTGWMSNRGRQNVASYLAKTLKSDWRKGAAEFEAKLIDYDVSSNWGNWAYLAGEGQDPRDRTFNTDRQAAMYDPEGLYRARWCK